MVQDPSCIPTKPLFSYHEARELLGDVPQSTFAWWIAKGLVQTVKIGPRRSFVPRAEIVRLASGIELPKAG